MLKKLIEKFKLKFRPLIVYHTMKNDSFLLDFDLSFDRCYSIVEVNEIKEKLNSSLEGPYEIYLHYSKIQIRVSSKTDIMIMVLLGIGNDPE
jgi:hypothetical protein